MLSFAFICPSKDARGWIGFKVFLGRVRARALCEIERSFIFPFSPVRVVLMFPQQQKSAFPGSWDPFVQDFSTKSWPQAAFCRCSATLVVKCPTNFGFSLPWQACRGIGSAAEGRYRLRPRPGAFVDPVTAFTLLPW